MEFIFHFFIYCYSILCWISSICPIKIFLKPPLPCSESQAIDLCGLHLWGPEPSVLQLGWPMGCSSRRVESRGRKKSSSSLPPPTRVHTACLEVLSTELPTPGSSNHSHMPFQPWVMIMVPWCYNSWGTEFLLVFLNISHNFVNSHFIKLFLTYTVCLCPLFPMGFSKIHVLIFAS